jgi:hypothetical protein
MTNPVLLRVLMVVAAIACFAASHFFPAQSPLLVPAGVGLLGWAKAAPGHDGTSGPGAGAAIGLVALAALALFLGCSSLPKVNPQTAARQGLREAAKLCDAYKRGAAAGDIPREPYLDDACSLLLEPTAVPDASAAPPGGGGA